MESEAGSFGSDGDVRVLIAEEDEIVLNSLKNTLQSEGYYVVTVSTGGEALERVGMETYQVAIVDQKVGDMDGLEILTGIKEQNEHTTRLLLTNGISVSEFKESIDNRLIFRYLTKPWLNEELCMTMRTSVDNYNMLFQNETLQSRNVQLNLKISDLQSGGEGEDDGAAAAGSDGGGQVQMGAAGTDAMVEGIIQMLYTYHPNLKSCAIRTMAMVKTLGEILEMSGKDMQTLLWAAALADVSLLGIDRPIIRRWMRDPEKCTDEEMELIKKHPDQSIEILKAFPVFEHTAPIIRSHHENWDKTGYPQGLKEEAIPWEARLLRVAMDFCNKHSNTVQAMNEIEAQSSVLYDPDAIRAVAKAIPLTKMPKGEREILLIELKEGMVLGRDIHNSNGFLLFPKGKKLSDANCNKLFGINRVSPLNPYVLVVC